MYYSSSSSGDEGENDHAPKERPMHLHSIASATTTSFHDSTSCKDDDDDDNGERTASPPSTPSVNEERGPLNVGNEERTSLSSSLSLASDVPNVASNEKVDDREAISTLLLEEKIVSLMNRVWILETENEVLRSHWKTQGDDKEHHVCEEDIESMYRDPYASPTSYNIHKNNESNNSTNEHGQSNNNNDDDDDDDDNAHDQNKKAFAFGESTAGGTVASLPSRLHVDTDQKPTKSENRPSLAEQNRSLKRDLAVSEEVQERMRVAMVSLEHRDKLRSEKIKTLSKEQEDAAKKHKQVLGSLRNRLESEQIKRQKLQADLEEAQNKKRDGQTLQQPPGNTGKECIDGSKGSLPHQPSSTVKAALLITDLSNELRRTMERESKLKEKFDQAMTEATRIQKEASESRDRYLRETGALLKHNEELESLNIELVKKLDQLEAQFDETVANKRNQERNNRLLNTNNEDMRKMQEYLYSLSVKYEESQREITSLKNRLALRETTATEFRARSTPTRISTHDNEILRVSASQTQKHNSRTARIEYTKEEDAFVFPDEEREEDDFAINSLFPNRVEI